MHSSTVRCLKAKRNTAPHFAAPLLGQDRCLRQLRSQGLLPVIVIRVEGLVAGLVTIDPLHEILHGISGITVPVIWAGQFDFLQQKKKKPQGEVRKFSKPDNANPEFQSPAKIQ